MLEVASDQASAGTWCIFSWIGPIGKRLVHLPRLGIALRLMSAEQINHSSEDFPEWRPRYLVSRGHYEQPKVSSFPIHSVSHPPSVPIFFGARHSVWLLRNPPAQRRQGLYLDQEHPLAYQSCGTSNPLCLRSIRHRIRDSHSPKRSWWEEQPTIRTPREDRPSTASSAWRGRPSPAHTWTCRWPTCAPVSRSGRHSLLHSVDAQRQRIRRATVWSDCADTA
mmetsp:Transcript_32208/g.94819  ORF Transcript_32208/g.94819 Transcript_32208/m.94819 type:complete len:222 (+) Transcript_32208:537-1202(+)